MSASADLVGYRQDAAIVTLTLQDEPRRNGLSPEMVDTLIAKLDRAAADADVRCIVLTASGNSFSAGGDPKRMLAPGLYPDMSATEIKRFYATGIQRLPLALAALDVPIIAAINGPAIGAGCDLACLCDIRIAAPAASFAVSFVKLGLVPGDGGAWILPRVISRSYAAQMLLSGDAVDAEEALRTGLVSAVVPASDLLAEAQRRAQRIAANPPHSVRLTKRLMNECESVSLGGALQLSAAFQAICHKMADHREAVEALLEKRTPHFSGR